MLERPQFLHIRIIATKRHLDLPGCKTKCCSRSIDSHFWNGTDTVSLLFLPVTMVDTLFIDVRNKSPVWLPNMEDQKSLTLRWPSFSGWDRDHVAIDFASKGGHYLIDGFVQPIADSITKMQHQKSLTLRWRSFSGWGSGSVAIVSATKGSQYFIYGCSQPIATEVTQDGKPKIFDTRLTLIFRMGQWSCCCLFCL